MEAPEAENVYVHPAVKCSSSMLGAKSLELCTEILGCETGTSTSTSSSTQIASDDSTDNNMSMFSFEWSSSVMRNTNENSGSKRLKRGSSFPPPLTSVTDLGGFHVRSHREDGRLILEAVAFSSPQPYFQAERGNGRLRLRLFESVDEVDADDEAEAETLSHEACGEEEVMEGYVRNGEDETGMTKFARPSRCKETGNRDIFSDAFVQLSSLSFVCL